MWIFGETIEPKRAEERLALFMREAARQKHHEILFDYTCTGIFGALMLSMVLVLLSRLSESGVSANIPVAILLSLTLLGSVIMARRRRPDDLRVAVLADIRLKLKQRLSTAWEFTRTQPGSEISISLAVAALKQRLPLPSEPVFPLRINTWGKLIPIAVALLVLASAVDLQRIIENPVIEQDETVVDEGKRLREFAEQLGALAEREGYSRSTVAADKARHLGARMESGSLSRREALSRLRQLGAQVTDQREAALYDGAGLSFDVSQTHTSAVTRDLESLGVRSMLQNLLDGRLAASDARALTLETSTLAQLGIDAAALEQALESFDAGSEEDLLEILEKLAGVDLDLQDAEALSEAEEALEQARGNLGDTSAESEAGAATRRGNRTPGGRGDSGAGIRAESIRSATDPSGMGPGTGYGPETSRKAGEGLGSPQDNSETILRPKSQVGAGDVFSAEARVLPRLAQPEVSTVELDARYAAQLEEVLSKENYPLHHKEFIRRYFLGLSLGENHEGSNHEP